MTTDAQEIPVSDVHGQWRMLTQTHTAAPNYVPVMDWVARHPAREDEDVRALFVAGLHEAAWEDTDGSRLLLNPQRMTALLVQCRELVRGEGTDREWTRAEEARRARQAAVDDLTAFVRSSWQDLSCAPDGAVFGQREYIERLSEHQRRAQERIFDGLDKDGRAIHPALFIGCWDLLPLQYHRRAMRLGNLPPDYVPWVMEQRELAALEVAT